MRGSEVGKINLHFVNYFYCISQIKINLMLQNSLANHRESHKNISRLFQNFFFCLSRCAVRLYNEVNCVTKRQRKKFFYSKSKKDRALIFNVCQESVEGQKKKFKRFFLCVKLINRSLSKDNLGKIKPRTLVRPCLFFRLRDDIIFNDNKKGSIRLII